MQGSYCLSEADAGSDVAAMTTRAVRDGDTWVLNGTKHWISGASVADFFVVFAKTDPAAGSHGVSAFVVDRQPGLRIGKIESKMGMHGSPTCEVVLEDVRVPAGNLLGEVGQGFMIAMHTLDRTRPMIAAQAVGIAQGAIDHSVAYMKERKAFGRPIADLQGLQFMLADMACPRPGPRPSAWPATRPWPSRPTPCRSSAGSATPPTSPSSGSCVTPS
jgi:alkylation response protein AidB-like acyl-CoA dehydrogenase